MGGQSPSGSEMPGFVIDVIKLDAGEYGVRIVYGPYDYVKEEL